MLFRSSLVLQPFYRALGSDVDGSGLGLAIVHQIVQQHGAELTIADARPRAAALAQGLGPGTLITVRFGLCAAASPAPSLAPRERLRPDRPSAAPATG